MKFHGIFMEKGAKIVVAIILTLILLNITSPQASTSGGTREFNLSISEPELAGELPLSKIDKDFSDLIPNELNHMPYEEFQKVADISLKSTTPSHIVSEWKFANDPKINDIKRGIFIDRLSVSDEPDVIPRFIKMYEETDNAEVKEN